MIKNKRPSEVKKEDCPAKWAVVVANKACATNDGRVHHLAERVDMAASAGGRRLKVKRFFFAQLVFRRTPRARERAKRSKQRVMRARGKRCILPGQHNTSCRFKVSINFTDNG